MSPCFTRVSGFDGGEGLNSRGCPRVLRGVLDLTAARASSRGGGPLGFTKVFGFYCGEGLIQGGRPLCFTRVFGFDCGEGLIQGGRPLCFTRVFGFDCGEGLIQGGATPVFYDGFWMTAARAY